MVYLTMIVKVIKIWDTKIIWKVSTLTLAKEMSCVINYLLLSVSALTEKPCNLLIKLIN